MPRVAQSNERSRARRLIQGSSDNESIVGLSVSFLQQHAILVRVNPLHKYVYIRNRWFVFLCLKYTEGSTCSRADIGERICLR